MYALDDDTKEKLQPMQIMTDGEEENQVKFFPTISSQTIAKNRHVLFVLLLLVIIFVYVFFLGFHTVNHERYAIEVIKAIMYCIERLFSSWIFLF